MAISYEMMLVAGVAIVACTFLSGVLGGGGGTILLGVLLLFLDVPTAMVAYACTQGTGNVVRAIGLRRSIQWSIVAKYLPGAFFSVILFSIFFIVPDKAFIYLCLGIFALSAQFIPVTKLPSLHSSTGPAICGAVVTSFQLMAGSAGILLDSFFQRSGLEKRRSVGTKTAILVIIQALRVGYFGTAAFSLGNGIDVWVIGGAAALAIIGTTLASPMLRRISQDAFVRLGSILTSGIALSFISIGLWMFVFR